MLSAGASAYKIAYEIAPIALTGGGVTSGLPGGMLSVASLLQTSTSPFLLSDGDLDPDNAFANFYPLAGSTLIENQVGQYPFANMTVAANCIIRQPLAVSMMMRVPARGPGGYALKTQVMTAFKNTLDQHNNAGGTYSVATPTFFYSDMLLVRFHDVSSGDTLQAQSTYQLDFVRPLVSLRDAAGAQSASMALLSSGGATDGALSGAGPSLGETIGTASPAAIPAFGGNIPAGTGVGSFGVDGVQTPGAPF